jgi:curved DNA-binding protein
MTKNYYDILKVTKESTADEIKKSYRKLSMKYHPDKNNGEDSKMKELTEAYNIIGDPIKKKRFDQESSAPNPEDLINMFFGNSGNVFFPTDIFQNARQTGNFPFFTNMQQNVYNNTNFVRILVHTVNITLEELYNNSQIKTIVSKTITTNNTSIIVNEEIIINVPPTLLDSDMVVLKGKGNVINNNKGDLKIKFKILEHGVFSVYNNDIIFCREIQLKDALCGFYFNIDYIDGKKYKINNTNTIISPTYRKEINNMGLLKNGQKGKLIIMFKILFPDKLSEETKQKIKELI